MSKTATQIVNQILEQVNTKAFPFGKSYECEIVLSKSILHNWQLENPKKPTEWNLEAPHDHITIKLTA